MFLSNLRLVTQLHFHTVPLQVGVGSPLARVAETHLGQPPNQEVTEISNFKQYRFSNSSIWASYFEKKMFSPLVFPRAQVRGLLSDQQATAGGWIWLDMAG